MAGASSAKTRTVTLPSREEVPALGQGTWHLAERADRRDEERAALRHGLDLGMSVVDTAEMYGSGEAESLVGEALADRRDEVFLVTKVLPHHADRRGTLAACEQSLRRLRTDHVDLYLLHWPGSVPLEETVAAFEQLRQEGKIRHWGVSNFDAADLAELAGVPHGDGVATDQVLYNLTRRGVEHDLLPACRQRGLPVMAYSPVEQGRILGHPALRTVADRHGASPAQVALAWVLRLEGVIAIPKASTRQHVEDNHAALTLQLSSDDLGTLDAAFPAPRGPQPLEML